jgi:hypothetical protein
MKLSGRQNLKPLLDQNRRDFFWQKHKYFAAMIPVVWAVAMHV